MFTQQMISSSSSSCGLCFLTTISPENQTQPPIFNRLAPPQSPIPNPQQLDYITRSLSIQSTRRKLLKISMIVSSIAPFISCRSSWAELLELERYTDMDAGFTLLRPTSWIKVSKAGATALFEDPIKGGNNVGVVVTPVRLTSLREFGDPEFVSNKLVQAEKRKESTKEVEIVSFKERVGQNEVYEFEYKLDSTRGGRKTIFSAAFVASNKLYLLNIAHSDPIDNHTRSLLEQLLHSFDVLPANH